MEKGNDKSGAEPDLAVVDAIVSGVGRGRRHVVAILRAIQKEFNYLPEWALRRVCEVSEISPAALYGVASFYPRFRFRPAGRYFIQVCVGTACHVKGAEAVYEAFRRHLGIPDGEDTDSERLFSVGKVACLGCCMLAPAVRIDDIVYGFVEPGGVGGVLRDFSRPKAEGGEIVLSPPESPDGVARLCLCSSCVAAGTAAIADELRRVVAGHGFSCRIEDVGCEGLSYQAPLLEIETTDGGLYRYGRLTVDDVERVLSRHFNSPRPLHRLALKMNVWLEHLFSDESWTPPVRFQTGDGDCGACGQVRLATEHAGRLPPLDLNAYRLSGGFKALEKVLSERKPEKTIEILTDSGLRGRGGAGFPTGSKWRSVFESEGDAKYVICNGDEGDPGAFMDRMLIESFPFRIIEGMLVAAATVGARKAILYVRDEYPLAAARFEEALASCVSAGLMNNILPGADEEFEIEIVQGAGAFVCGEETALIAALEGRRGTPAKRPPYPSEKGLWGCPTLINNVETFSLVPWILNQGHESFTAFGNEHGRGTKTFALAGKIKRGGLVEVPLGMSLRQVVEDIGGGVPEGRELKAILIGGPSGGCVPASLADTPVDYHHLAAADAIMGSGGMVVLDDSDCMVEIARYFLEFTRTESCGKCVFCRTGTQRMLDILTGICGGGGEAGDIEELERLAAAVSRYSLCGLGRTAPNPALSTIRHFRGEYEAHIAGRCPAGVCKALISYEITGDCIGCGICARDCPVDAIPPVSYAKHVIDQDKCVRCGTCFKNCPNGAVVLK